MDLIYHWYILNWWWCVNHRWVDIAFISWRKVEIIIVRLFLGLPLAAFTALTYRCHNTLEMDY